MAAPFSYKKLKQKLSFYLKHKQNVLLEGRHGTAKTTMITEVFNEAFGADKWIYLSGATLDPWVDFVGVPREEKNAKGEAVLDFVLPRRLVDNQIKAIFIDEYNRTNKKVRNATMELIQFKSINGRKFPDLEVVWVAVNPFTDDEMEQSYDVENIDAAQLDRFQIQIKLPYFPDATYFTTKFGADWSKAAIEWWVALKEEMKYKISPRRLDYALEVAQFGGEVSDVLPFESNSAKLATSLVLGNIEDKLNEIRKKGDYDRARIFINIENNYQSSKDFLEKDADIRRFFLPLLEDERLTAMFFGKDKVRSFMLKNPVFFKEFLETVLHAEASDPKIKAAITIALKAVEGIEMFNGVAPELPHLPE